MIRRAVVPALIALSACRSGTTSPDSTTEIKGQPVVVGQASGCDLDIHVVGHLHRFDGWGTGTMQDPEERIRRIAAMGLGGTRLAFEWSQVEPLQGQHDWGNQDRLIGLLRQNGLKTFGVLLFSPSWARPPGEDHTHRPIVQGSAARGDTAFASFAAAAARRYVGVIDRWEIWNEPNILKHHFWRHVRDSVEYGPDPVDYLSLYEVARDSILAANPSARVAVGALANGPEWGPVLSSDPHVRWRWGFPAWAFLRGLLDAGLQPTDLGLHPYPYQPTLDVHPALDSAKAVLDAYGYPNARLWVTEWGIDYKLPGLDTLQAVRLTQRGLSHLCHDPRVDLVTVFALTENGRRDYSLVRLDGTVTNSGHAVSDWITSQGEP